MARANPLMHDYGQPPAQGEWQALRGELAALLDQVEDRIEQTAAGGSYEGLARRVHDLRQQMGIEADNRQREALMSVKRAVDRFTDRDEARPAENPRSALNSAIEEIKARQRALSAMPVRIPGQDAAEAAPRLEEMARGVSSLGSRLERVEAQLGGQARQQNSLADIASQVQQLTQVVELLAGAVGETGQVKRLEAQIAGLAKLVSRPADFDASALGGKLDDLSATIERLADLQIQQVERSIRTADSTEKARVETSKGQADAMRAIEASVRTIYDRIDAIERNFALPPAELDRLTDEMRAFTEAMRGAPGPALPETLLAQVEMLGGRLAQLESQGGEAMLGLRDDVAGLRGAVLDTMEPRFFALESRLETLAAHFEDGDAGADDDLGRSVAQIEAQLRQLVARMDQTGEQLSGLAQSYAGAGAPQFDVEEIASILAKRTGEVLAKTRSAGVALSDGGLKSIEERLSLLLDARTTGGPGTELAALAEAIRKVDARIETLARQPSDLGNLHDGVRRVDERLERLESLLGPQAPRRVAALAPADPVEEAEDDLAAVRRALTEKLGAPETPAAAVGADDDDLDVMPVGPIRARPEPARPAPAAARAAPPAPAPQVDERDAPAFPSDTGPAAPLYASAGPQVTSRNTFIEAARRAARRQNPSNPAAPDSVIGRAWARVQSKPGEIDAAAAAAPGIAPIEPEADDPAETPRESFISRHRRPILLVAALLAVSLLTLNLVAQRLDGAPATSEQPAAEAPAAPTVEPTAEPRVIAPAASTRNPALDPRPIAQAGLDTAALGAVAPPDAILAFSPIVASTGTGAPLGTSFATPALAAAEALALPPETLGPLALREAAAQGDARAQFEVAAVYSEGRVVPQDFAEAAVWYERAAAQGFAPAQYRLGNLYEEGRGVFKDLEAAKLWYLRAAEAGNRMSMHNLAALYASGELEAQEFDRAAEWFGQAAARGMKDSQFNLGMLYARGLGVAQDFEQSYKWFALAAKTGDQAAAEKRDEMARSLPADAIARLDGEIAAWRAEPIDIKANFAPIGTWAEGFDPGQPIQTRAVVEKVQAVLARLGYDVGTPDGLNGPKTVDAIKAFEAATGMSAVGAINPRLLAVLGSQPV